MDVFYAYTFSTAGWLGLQALPLIVTPKLIVTLLADEYHHTSDTEAYFCRSLGLALGLIAIIVLFFTGSIPLSSDISKPLSQDDNDPRGPYAVPIVGVTTFFHSVILVHCWVRWINSGQTGYILGATGYGIMAAMGLWCVMFATSGGRISKRTGADKRTTGYPFKNTAAYDKKWDRKQI